MAREWDFYPQVAARIRIATELVAADHGLDPDEILTRTKAPEIAHPRQLVVYLCLTELGLGLTTLRRVLGIHHATAIHSVDRVQTCAEKDRVFAEYLRGLRGRLRKLAGGNGALRPREFLAIAQTVAEFYEVPLLEVLRTGRRVDGRVRHVFWYLLGTRFGLTAHDVAEWVGVDHGSVDHALSRIGELRKQNSDIDASIRYLLRRIEELGDSRVTA